MGELLSCPFCGHDDPELYEQINAVRCMNSDCALWAVTPAIPLEKWNTRTPDHVLLPSEPTEAMIEAGRWEAFEKRLVGDPEGVALESVIAAIYRAMLKELENG